jgi:hypothetical protein
MAVDPLYQPALHNLELGYGFPISQAQHATVKSVVEAPANRYPRYRPIRWKYDQSPPRAVLGWSLTSLGFFKYLRTTPYWNLRSRWLRSI